MSFVPSLCAGLLALVVAMPAALAQVSSAAPPQTIGTLATDKEPPTDLQLVQRQLAAGHAAQALELADDSLKKNPRDAQMRFLRGVILTELKRPADALAVFQGLTEDFPELPEPYNNLAVLYAAEGRLDNARAALELALAAAPNYGTAYENLGDIYLQLAADAYQRATKLEPANKQAGAKLAMSRELITKARNVR
ncbi:MAG TPA: tetratricopeptide repeat protein [Burkholderiaceae bacterium]|nr:tetratricopeptide repeat protein [Burkholderiaceae bacterium]HQR69248.1 tetratricopeptide repeat protein [Burkholderiaceae bacterium]